MSRALDLDLKEMGKDLNLISKVVTDCDRSEIPYRFMGRLKEEEKETIIKSDILHDRYVRMSLARHEDNVGDVRYSYLDALIVDVGTQVILYILVAIGVTAGIAWSIGDPMKGWDWVICAGLAIVSSIVTLSLVTRGYIHKMPLWAVAMNVLISPVGVLVIGLKVWRKRLFGNRMRSKYSEILSTMVLEFMQNIRNTIRDMLKEVGKIEGIKEVGKEDYDAMVKMSMNISIISEVYEVLEELIHKVSKTRELMDILHVRIYFNSIFSESKILSGKLEKGIREYNEKRQDSEGLADDGGTTGVGRQGDAGIEEKAAETGSAEVKDGL